MLILPSAFIRELDGFLEYATRILPHTSFGNISCGGVHTWLICFGWKPSYESQSNLLVSCNFIFQTLRYCIVVFNIHRYISLDLIHALFYL